MVRLRLIGMLASVALLAGGCVQTAMLPAHQLESDETVASIGLDEPGVLFIPRANVQFTSGMDGGDLSLNLSGPPLGAGITGRYYLSDDVNAELQVQGASLTEDADRLTGLALLGLQEVPTGDDVWYIGGQAGFISGPPFLDMESAQSGPAQTHPVVGGTLGMGPFDLGEDWQIQLELEGNAPLAPGSDEPPLPATRLSIGFFYHGD